MLELLKRLLRFFNLYYPEEKPIKTVSYATIDNAVKKLKNIEAPEEIFPFFVIGTLLGISLVQIHKHMTTKGSRQLMWLKMRNVWGEKIKNIEHSKSKWTRFKNKITSLLGGISKKYYQGYSFHLNNCINDLLKFYSCLYQNGIIQSSQIEIIEQSDSKSPVTLSQLPKNLFGGKFKKEKIGTIGTLLYLINSDLSAGGNVQEGLPECEDSFIKAGEELIFIKFFLNQLGETRATKKIDEILIIYHIIAPKMNLPTKFTLSSESAKMYLENYKSVPDFKKFIDMDNHIESTSALKKFIKDSNDIDSNQNSIEMSLSEYKNETSKPPISTQGKSTFPKQEKSFALKKSKSLSLRKLKSSSPKKSKSLSLRKLKSLSPKKEKSSSPKHISKLNVERINVMSNMPIDELMNL